jgi:hypothetical protein
LEISFEYRVGWKYIRNKKSEMITATPLQPKIAFQAKRGAANYAVTWAAV